MDKDLIIIAGQNMKPKNYNGQRVVTLRDIDTVHGRPEGTARKRFNDHKDRLIEGEDFCKITASEFRTRFDPTHSLQATEDITLITESGYLMLVKSFTDDLAWSVQRDLVSNYFRTKAPASMEDILIYQLQEMKAVKSQMTALDARVDNIRDIVALNPNDWRRDARAIIVKIAQSLGGIELIRDVQHEIFMLVDERAKVDLKRRLTNMRRRMLEEGASKTQCKKANTLDVIAADRKLIEIYLIIVKDMAIRNGIKLDKENMREAEN